MQVGASIIPTPDATAVALSSRVLARVTRAIVVVGVHLSRGVHSMKKRLSTYSVVLLRRKLYVPLLQWLRDTACYLTQIWFKTIQVPGLGLGGVLS